MVKEEWKNSRYRLYFGFLIFVAFVFIVVVFSGVYQARHSVKDEVVGKMFCSMRGSEFEHASKGVLTMFIECYDFKSLGDKIVKDKYMCQVSLDSGEVILCGGD